MNMSEMLKEPVVSVLEQLRLALWVEIVTEQPQCTYYFGPFACAKSAQKPFWATLKTSNRNQLK